MNSKSPLWPFKYKEEKFTNKVVGTWGGKRSLRAFCLYYFDGIFGKYSIWFTQHRTSNKMEQNGFSFIAMFFTIVIAILFMNFLNSRWNQDLGQSDQRNSIVALFMPSLLYTYLIKFWFFSCNDWLLPLKSRKLNDPNETQRIYEDLRTWFLLDKNHFPYCTNGKSRKYYTSLLWSICQWRETMNKAWFKVAFFHS